MGIFSAAQPTEVDWPVFEGMSCLPPGLGDFLSRPDSTCELGGMPSYIVNVTNGMPFVSPRLMSQPTTDMCIAQLPRSSWR